MVQAVTAGQLHAHGYNLTLTTPCFVAVRAVRSSSVTSRVWFTVPTHLLQYKYVFN